MEFVSHLRTTCACTRKSLARRPRPSWRPGRGICVPPTCSAVGSFSCQDQCRRLLKIRSILTYYAWESGPSIHVGGPPPRRGSGIAPTHAGGHYAWESRPPAVSDIAIRHAKHTMTDRWRTRKRHQPSTRRTYSGRRTDGEPACLLYTSPSPRDS